MGPLTLHSSDLWALRKAEHQLIERTEMMRLMLGDSRAEKIRNVEIRIGECMCQDQRVQLTMAGQCGIWKWKAKDESIW